MKLNYTLLIGIPASGKSTFSYKFIRENENTIRWNRDAFREMMFPKHNELIKKNFKFEKFINGMYKDFINQEKYNILDDNTNLMTIHKFKSKVHQLKKYNLNVVVLKDSFDLDLCINRNSNRERKVPEDIMQNMHNKFIKNISEIKKYCDEINVRFEEL